MVDMRRHRIVSVVEETWGKGTIFTDEPLDEPIVSAQKRLSYLQSSLYSTILEDIITQLRILESVNNELHIHKTMSDMGLLRALKFCVEQPKCTDELEGIDPHNLGCMKYKLNKLVADRKYLANIMKDLYIELALDKTYDTLRNSVKVVVNRNDHLKFLLEDEAKNRIIRRDLNKQLRQQRNHIKSVIYDTDVHIEDLNSQVEDAVLNSECCSRYVDNWQRARTEQHIQSIKDQEYSPSTTIEYYKRRYDHEQRVHSEVELLVNIMINETLAKVEGWMDKYDKDMEGIDLKIQIKKNDFQNERDRRIELEETIEKHDKLMKDWVHFKDEREKARLYREKMTNAAITVQAWWRGLLVRLQLGPYKVPKKKGAGPPGAKKK
ncbi:dynein regulatory complex protein 9 [Amyelois transitella]|uniref:dynein regulatory complex protein 9 n=1 Tax=Amyelois transitella TaxID=680683 RepID=UPI00298F9664|nr:dynein regulatory complex protein 9 [Amyelois transitella]